VDGLKAPGKPFDIPKRAVWEAYEKVKANKGAPGVDAVSIGEFEKDLKGNLYKIWLCRAADYAEWEATGDRSACWRRWAALIGSA
jgi:hypothetical protein